jgi:hypothetical protein
MLIEVGHKMTPYMLHHPIHPLNTDGLPVGPASLAEFHSKYDLTDCSISLEDNSTRRQHWEHWEMVLFMIM